MYFQLILIAGNVNSEVTSNSRNCFKLDVGRNVALDNVVLSNMKKYSEDKFILKSALAPDEIKDILQSRTLIKKNLTNESTDKDFIGRFNERKFSIFDSSFFPNGVACVMHGEINQDSEIILTTTLHKGLRIVLLVWSIVMTGLFIGFWFINSSKVDLVLIPIFMPIAVLLFRLILHGQYVYTRNRAMRKIKGLLQIDN
jgi:hypothetical protein